MRGPETNAEVRVATFIHAFPGRDLVTISGAIAMEYQVAVHAAVPLAACGVVRAESGTNGGRETYHPTGQWSPERD